MTLTLSLVCALNANIYFDIGAYKPKASHGGVIWGLELFQPVDERFTLTGGGNLFIKQKNDKVSVPNDIGGTTTRWSRENNYYFVPMLAGVKINLMEKVMPVPFVGAGIGWGLCWNYYYESFEDGTPPINETRYYHGFTWQINGGALIELTSAVELYGKLYYTRAPLKRRYDDITGGKMTDDLNMSGMGISFGIRVPMDWW